jgi:predicted nuclease of restriction endonuclease-like (RecB) superfamily
MSQLNRTRKVASQAAKRVRKKVAPVVRQFPKRTKAGQLGEVLLLIAAAQQRAYQAVNTELVGLYWELGGYISRKIACAEWGDGVVDELAATKKVSPPVTQIHPTAADEFKSAYSLEFLGLTQDHSESDLHGALLRNLGRFINELGRDFCFVGSEYPVQVGNQDFAIDLVFFHRSLTCLVAFELKVREFRPEDLGKLNFYLEALDRDVKKPHERPSIGMLVCATRTRPSAGSAP